MQRLAAKLVSAASITALLTSSSITLLLLGIAGGPAAAQQPSQAQVSAIRAACRADYRRTARACSRAVRQRSRA